MAFYIPDADAVGRTEFEYRRQQALRQVKTSLARARQDPRAKKNKNARRYASLEEALHVLKFGWSNPSIRCAFQAWVCWSTVHGPFFVKV